MLEAVIKSIIFVILLALGGYFVVVFHRRHWGNSGNSNTDFGDSDRITVLNRLPVGNRQFIAVVKCNQQKFLVGISPAGMVALGELKVSQNHDPEPCPH